MFILICIHVYGIKFIKNKGKCYVINNAVEIDKTFFTNTDNNKETIVKMGQVLGKKR